MRHRLALASLLLVSGGALGFVVSACTVPTTSKSDLKVCTAGEDGCPSEKPKRTTTPGEPSKPGPGAEVPTEVPGNRDAGTDGSADERAAFGPLCLKLKTCCEAFVENGIFSDFCYEALETKKESICYTKHQSYITDPENQFCTP